MDQDNPYGKGVLMPLVTNRWVGVDGGQAACSGGQSVVVDERFGG